MLYCVCTVSLVAPSLSCFLCKMIFATYRTVQVGQVTRNIAVACSQSTAASITAGYNTCSDVPGTVDGCYMLHPPSSNITVAANEDIIVPAAWARVYCRFKVGRAWALVGRCKDRSVNVDWATAGRWDYSSSPLPDDTSSGVTDRFPLKFWNDLA